MKIVGKENSSLGRVITRVVLLILLAGLLVFMLIFPQVLISENVANFYSGKVFPVIAFLRNTIFSSLPVSVTEFLVVVGSLALILIVVYNIVKLVKIRNTKGVRAFFKRLCTTLTCVLIIASVLALDFQLMHGINYRRTDAATRLGLVTRQRSVEEMQEALFWAYENMVQARSMLGEDYTGASHMMSSFDEAALYADELVSRFSNFTGLEMSRNFVRAKPVAISDLWIYTNIVGVYDPFLGEANINVDRISPTDMPTTMCHEVAHAKGYGREYDCDLIAVLSCCMASRADFRYCGYLAAFEEILSIMPNVGEYMWLFSSEEFQPVARDMNADEAYFLSLTDNVITQAVATVSEDVNDSYLEANGQEGGTLTYLENSNYYVEFYFTYVKGEV